MRISDWSSDVCSSDLFGGWDLGEPPVEQRLAGRDHLHHDGVARLEVALDRRDQGRALHGGQEMVEEALLVGFEGRSRGSLGVAVQGAFGTGDVGRLERRLDVLVDRSEEHTSELQSLMRISYAVFCLK